MNESDDRGDLGLEGGAGDDKGRLQPFPPLNKETSPRLNLKCKIQRINGISKNRAIFNLRDGFWKYLTDFLRGKSQINLPSVSATPSPL